MVRKRRCRGIGLALFLMLLLSACNTAPGTQKALSASAYPQEGAQKDGEAQSWRESLPAYDREAWVDINGSVPFFTREDMTTEAFEVYSELDESGRCGPAYANICEEIMPEGPREDIGNVRPSGWHTVKYEMLAELYLYNRCHLIGYQLAGENANEKNLITGTRYLNVEGMLYWENLVAAYVEETGNHVLYRVTPDFEGENLVASGVRMEAYSVEDEGEGVCFHVYCYNVQPGIIINYLTGESSRDETWSPLQAQADCDYIVNTNTGRFHFPFCDSVKNMSEKNKRLFNGERLQLIDEGYTPCGRCKP